MQEGVEVAVDRFGERPFFTAKDVVKALEEGTNNLVPRTTPAKVSIPKGKSFGGSVGGAAGDAFGAIGKAGSAFGGAIGGLFSDLRLKSRLTHVGEYKPGVGIYEWEWTKEALELGADPNRTRGVLAQDVQHVDPEAVSRGDDGYLRIAEHGSTAPAHGQVWYHGRYRVGRHFHSVILPQGDVVGPRLTLGPNKHGIIHGKKLCFIDIKKIFLFILRGKTMTTS